MIRQNVHATLSPIFIQLRSGFSAFRVVPVALLHIVNNNYKRYKKFLFQSFIALLIKGEKCVRAAYITPRVITIKYHTPCIYYIRIL